MIASWWTSLSVSMQILWGITLASSLVFIIQSVLTFIGADADSNDLGGDFDMSSDDPSMAESGSGMSLLTFRNLVNFLLGFGWSAILLQDSIQSTALLLIISTFVGIFLVTIVMLLFKWLSGMQQSGNINLYKSAAGCKGKVYLTIPAQRKGVGKVQITINNAVREYNALTDSEKLATGTPIQVVEVIDESTVLVEETQSMII